MKRRFSYHVSRILPVLAAFMVLLAILLVPPSLKVWQASAVQLADSPPTVVTQPDHGTLVRTAWSGVTTTLEGQRFWDAPLHSTTVMFLQGQRILQQAVIPGPDDTVRLIVQFRDDPLAVYIQRTGHVPGRFTASELDAVRSYAEQLAATRRHALVEMQQQGIRAEVNHEFGYLFNGMALSVKMRDWQTLKQLPQVKAVEPDYDVRADLSDSVPLIGAPSVWAMTDAKGQAVNGQGVRVAILDTGIDYTHPDLGGGIGPTYKVIGGYDFINNDADPMDDNGHGTHVAGIVAANGVLKGVAPGANLLAFKVLDANGRGSTSTIIAGLERAADPDDNPTTDDGADVINMSLGGAGTPDGPLSQAVDNAVNHGIVVVVAAGNSGPYYETIGCPGVARKALTVAASDKYDTLADFSSRGPVPGYADVIKPDITAPGVSIQSTVPLYGPLGSPTRYRSLDGTSMATPHVAGAAALIRQLHPDWAPELIKVNLMNTAKNLGRGMFEQGTGRVDVDAAARAPATILPGSVAFGWDDLDQPIWSTTKTLTITNRSASASTYSLTLAAALPQGITVTFSPANVSLSPGEPRPVLVSLTVDNRIVPNSSTPSHPYEGQVIARSGPNAWKIPFAFIKMPLLNVTFDESPALIGVHNEVDKWWFPSNPGLSMPMYVPPGTYDIMVAYGDIATWVVKERIPVTAKTDVTILKSEAANEVQLKLLDANSHEIPPSGWFSSPIGFSALKHKASGVTIALGGAAFNFQPDPRRLHFSNISPAYRYEARIPAQSEATNWDYYDFSYLLTDGITTSMTVSNDPRQFKKVEYEYKPVPLTQQLWRAWWWNTEEMGIAVIPAAERQLIPPFKEQAYYVPTSPDAVWKWGSTQVFTAFSNLNEWDPSYTPPLYQTPFLHARDPETMDLYLDTRSPANLSVTSDYLPVGSAPPHWRGKFENQDYAIIPNVPQVAWGLLVLNQVLDKTSYGSLPYELYQSGKQIDSGIITRSPISLRTPGAYTMTVPYTHYYVRGRPGSARATIGFDTSNAADKNPPYLLSLNVMVGDRMVESLTPSEVGEIRFAAGDDTGLGQVTLAYQAGGAWQELPLHQSGNVFTATVPTGLGDSYVALRITARDTQGNWLAFEVNPAFYVLIPLSAVTINGPAMGVVGKDYAFIAHTSPVAAAQPITYVWQATGQSPVTQTNGSNDVVNFIWSAVGAQFITVTAANEIGAVTGTHALSILTQTQAISHNVELVSQTGGPLNAVAVQGNYAHVGIGPSMVILNISNPGLPAVVGHMGFLPDIVYRIAVSSQYAYIANGYGGLRIVDILNPASPREIGFYQAEGFDAWGGVTVAGNYAYVAGTSGLYIINISNPANPRLVGFFSTPEAARNVVLSGTYAYVAAGNHGLYVVNVSDPAYPQEVAIYLEAAHDVAIAGSYAYVADDVVGFRIINISNPSQPYQVGSYPMTNLHYVSVANDYAYVVNDQYLNVIRVSDPAHPTWISKFYIADDGPPHGAYTYTIYPGRGIQVANGYAYVVNDTSLSLINITNPSSLRRVGSYDTPAVAPSAVAVSGVFAYAANEFRGLRIFNVQDPAHPARIGAYDTPGVSLGVAVDGPYAYLASGDAGLRILNVLYPTNPTEISFLDTYKWAGSVTVAEGYAYIADGQDGLRIARVRDAAHPKPVGSYDTPGSAQNVVVSGTYAYVADSEGGLRIINVSDRAHPTEVGSVHTAGQAMDVAVEGNYAYVADSWGWLRIVNVSDPAHPTVVSSFGNMAGPVYDVAVMQGYAYVIDDDGLHVIYVSDPAHPAEVGFYELPPAERYASGWRGSNLTVTAAGYIYFAGSDLGLVILRYHPAPLAAAFTATPTRGVPPLTVAFTNQSSGDVTSNLWNFGDGVTSTLASLTHTYSAVGAYTVTLTVNGPGGSDTLTRANHIRVYLPQPILVAPVCGTTNNTQPVVRGLAPDGFVITLYDQGAQLLTTTTTVSHTFAMTPSLAAGQHVLTATATNAVGTGLASRPLTLTVNPSLVYDPIGVTFAYTAPAGTVTQHPRDSSGCSNPEGWRVWLRQGYTTTVIVPVSYTTSAVVTVTLGDQTRVAADMLGTLQTPLNVTFMPPLNAGALIIVVTADGQTVTAIGSALIDPDGVVFDKNKWESQGITQTLAGVSVTCEVSDTVANQWMTWAAWAYDGQINPQVTGADGYYSFFVPAGIYRITADHPNYWPYTSPDIAVVDTPARLNIPLVLVRRVYLPIVLRQSP